MIIIKFLLFTLYESSDSFFASSFYCFYAAVIGIASMKGIIVVSMHYIIIYNIIIITKYFMRYTGIPV